MIYITKPLRKKIALACAKIVGEVFETDPPKIEQGDGYSTDCFRSGNFYADRDIYRTATGELSVLIDVSPRMLNLFCRLAPKAGVGVPLTQAEKDLARLVGGNTYSGKVNLHLSPQGKVTESDIEGFILTVRHHLLTLKHGTRNYDQEAA